MAATFDFTRRLKAVSDRDVDRLRAHFLEPGRSVRRGDDGRPHALSRWR